VAWRVRSSASLKLPWIVPNLSASTPTARKASASAFKPTKRAESLVLKFCLDSNFAISASMVYKCLAAVFALLPIVSKNVSNATLTWPTFPLLRSKASTKSSKAAFPLLLKASAAVVPKSFTYWVSSAKASFCLDGSAFSKFYFNTLILSLKFSI